MIQSCILEYKKAQDGQKTYPTGSTTIRKPFHS